MLLEAKPAGKLIYHSGTGMKSMFYLDLYVLQPLHEILILHSEIFGNLSMGDGPKLCQKAVCDANEPARKVGK